MTAYSNNLLGALSLALTDRVAAALEATLGIGGNAGPALLSIATRPGESIDQLSRVLGLTHSATVRMVDRLEQRGWVRRDRGGSDGRTASLTLTSTGRATFRRLLKARNTALNQVTDVLEHPDNETLQKLLAKMLASLPRNRADARHICRMCEHGVCLGARCPVGNAV